MISNDIKQGFLIGQKLLKTFIDDDNNFGKIEEACHLIVNSINLGGMPIIAGNGGSITDAMHFAEELTGRFRDNRKALPALALADPSFITCVANDFGFDEIFARGIEAYGTEKSIFIGLSTSGNSENIIKAVKKAKSIGMKNILLLGKDGGKLKNKAEIEFIIPGLTSDRVQEIHMFILHTIVEGIEKILFPENYM